MRSVIRVAVVVAVLAALGSTRSSRESESEQAPMTFPGGVSAPVAEPVKVVSDPVRLADYQRILRAITAVAATTQDPEAVRLAEWAQREAVPVAPGVESGQPWGYWLAQPAGDPEQALTIMPLRTVDRQLGEPWASLLGPQSHSFYGVADGLQVALWLDKLTCDRILGVVALHELLHADQYRRLRFDPATDTDEAWRRREREAYLLQHRLLAAVGGQPYERLMDRLVREQLKTARHDQSGWSWRMIAWEPELGQIFRPTETAAAQQALRSMAFHDVIFRCLARLEPIAAVRTEGELAAMVLTY